MYNFGGSPRGVELIETDRVRISDIHAQADMDAGAIKLSTQIRNDLTTSAEGRLTATVRLRDSDLMLTRQEMPLTVPSGEGACFVEPPRRQPRWWSPETRSFTS